MRLICKSNQKEKSGELNLRIERQDGLLIAADEQEWWKILAEGFEPSHVVSRFDDVFPRHRQRHNDEIGFCRVLQQILAQSQVAVGLVLHGQQLCLRYMSCNKKNIVKIIESRTVH